jgi:hypothetical protein
MISSSNNMSSSSEEISAAEIKNKGFRAIDISKNIYK